MESYGVPPEALTDDDLERQRAEAYATREWALHRGTDEQFQRHATRLLELEQEHLRRQLRRQVQEWRAVSEEATRLSNALRGLVTQLEDRLDAQPVQVAAAMPTPPLEAVSAALEAIIATGSWAPQSHLELEVPPEHGLAEEKRGPADRATPASIDRAGGSPNWGGWFGVRHQASA